MGKSIGRKIVMMLSLMGLLVILTCILNSSALSYVAGFNKSISKEVKNLKSAIEAGNQEEVAASEEKIEYYLKHGIIRVDGTIIFDNILLIVAIIQVIVMGFFASKNIVKPVRSANSQLTGIIDNIKDNKGDLTTRIEVKSSDEIGQLVSGVNNFIDQLQKLMQKIQTSSQNMLMSADEVKKSVDESGQGAMNVSAAAQELAAGIVKDFSRFSRDHIEQGKYIEQIFPFMGVRFIAINDNYDSANYVGGIGEIDVAFREFFMISSVRNSR